MGKATSTKPVVYAARELMCQYQCLAAVSGAFLQLNVFLLFISVKQQKNIKEKFVGEIIYGKHY